MGKIRTTYKILRSILFSAVITATSLYLLLYIVVSIPSVQDKIRSVACTELSKFLGGPLTIDHLDFRPFNEAVLTDVTLCDPDGQQVASIKRVGAGIALWKLISEGKIEITYAELIEPDIRLWKETPDSPINIQFLIDAVSPKDKRKPPTKFDLRIRNVVLRGCKFSFDKRWIPLSDNGGIDFNHISLSAINADIEFPNISNDNISADFRRLAFRSQGGLEVEKIGGIFHITPTSLSVKELEIKLPGSDIRPSDFDINFKSFAKITDALATGMHRIYLLDNIITPADFRAFLPGLSAFNSPFMLNLEISGNLSDLSINEFRLSDDSKALNILLETNVKNLANPGKCIATIDALHLQMTEKFGKKLTDCFPQIPGIAAEIISQLGNINTDFKGYVNIPKQIAAGEGIINTDAGNADFALEGHIKGDSKMLAGNLKASDLDLGLILNNDNIGTLSAEVQADIKLTGKDIFGSASVLVPSVVFKGTEYTNITAEVTRTNTTVEATANLDDPNLQFNFAGNALLAGKDSEWHANLSAANLTPSQFATVKLLDGYTLSGDISLDLTGNNPDNIAGDIRINGLSAVGGKNGDISMRELYASSTISEDSCRELILDCDWLSAKVEGNFRPTRVPALIQGMLAKALPSIIPAPKHPFNENDEPEDGKFNIHVAEASDLIDFLNPPVSWLTEFEINGSFSSDPGTFTLSTDLPYLRQGTKKLIRDTQLRVNLNESKSYAGVRLATVYPTNKGDLALDIDLSSIDNEMLLAADFNKNRNVSFYGTLKAGAELTTPDADTPFGAKLHIYPSEFYLNKAKWELNETDIDYSSGLINIDGFNLRHGSQYIKIAGVAGPESQDKILVDLSNIDIQYIFDTLNINYVNFGGFATGEVEASQVLSKNPIARTKRLHIKNLLYNNALLGDGDFTSSWDNAEKCVRLAADIREGKERRVKMDGGIWVTRDSLSLDFNTNKVNVAFLQPFMSAFAEKFEGRASGHALLYGTFRDIDLRGRLFADSVALKLGFTNVTYTASDSVIINPGHIEIPALQLRDRNGNTATFSGVLTHRYFHEPEFNFKLTDARNFLCYDTNERLNPDWYGTIYCNGTGSLVGKPGYVSLQANMRTADRSTFTFVLNDRLDAADYQFLHFTDKRKEAEETQKTDSEPEFLKQFRKKVEEAEGAPTVFDMDLRVEATPAALMTLVMDPAGGDKITARGNGNLNIGYNTGDDEMTIYGRYQLSQGVYNFTLQDLILKDFTIKPESSISFHGDPLDADLDISASYRVNTNLTDLDQSFSYDKDLNRTNVPVDAVLMVKGNMTSPNVTFDLDLPTLTDETARKVRSIISTQDMMSRQIIYLLALNRFYTPEYMGTSSNGGEWASVASSTLSSQLSNMIGQLTDKVNLMPSFRSDKGDFSDVEVDVALSSRLLNNRLLINGNFGYRDHSTSNTVFVGDFDIEYLLNRNGNLRLKAYNHFNDQNYYLRSAMTTQGIGIIYRKDFDNPFTFLKPKRKKKKNTVAPADSLRIR